MKNIKILENRYPKKSIDMAFSFTATGEGKKDGAEILTKVTYLMDYEIIDPEAKVLQIASWIVNDQISNAYLFKLLDSLKLYEWSSPGGFSIGQKIEDFARGISKEPFVGDGGIGYIEDDPDGSYKDRTIFIPPIKLIEGKTYHLLVKDHRWLIFTPGAILNGHTYATETRELALQILNVGKPIPKEEVLRTECEQCSEMYLAYKKTDSSGEVQDISDLSKEDQRKICEEDIGGKSTNYCVWTDISGYDTFKNSCKANTENDDCYVPVSTTSTSTPYVETEEVTGQMTPSQ
tara:strand:- start:35 stop:907 length:873 start_codon:yes stop_codon:yes gene_type:complete